MTYREYRQATMHKQAAGWTEALGGLVNTGMEALNTGGAYLIAAAMLGGVATGATIAKVTAHNAGDMDTARKSYENQRLTADIGYLKNRIQQERAMRDRKQAPKEAYVMGR